jgi:hypothetical protein
MSSRNVRGFSDSDSRKRTIPGNASSARSNSRSVMKPTMFLPARKRPPHVRRPLAPEIDTPALLFATERSAFGCDLGPKGGTAPAPQKKRTPMSIQLPLLRRRCRKQAESLPSEKTKETVP